MHEDTIERFRRDPITICFLLNKKQSNETDQKHRLNRNNSTCEPERASEVIEGEINRF